MREMIIVLLLIVVAKLIVSASLSVAGDIVRADREARDAKQDAEICANLLKS